jgi:hypothetical protein
MSEVVGFCCLHLQRPIALSLISKTEHFQSFQFTGSGAIKILVVGSIFWDCFGKMAIMLTEQEKSDISVLIDKYLLLEDSFSSGSSHSIISHFRRGVEIYRGSSLHLVLVR